MDSWTSLSSACHKNDGWCKPTSEQGRGLFLAILPWRSFCRLRWNLDNMRSNGGFWRLSSDVSCGFWWLRFFFLRFFVWFVSHFRDVWCFSVILSGFAWFLVYIMFFWGFVWIWCPEGHFRGGGLWSNRCCFPAYPLLIHHLGLSSG